MAANTVMGSSGPLETFKPGEREFEVDGFVHTVLLLQTEKYYLGGALRIIDPTDEAIIGERVRGAKRRTLYRVFWKPYARR